MDTDSIRTDGSADLSDDELNKLWVFSGEVPDPVEECIHDIIATVVSQHPEDVAVDAWDGKLTYAELDMLSSRLAAHLAQFGVETDDVVPICFEKSMWTVVAMLGVLKSSAAFALVGINQPDARLRSMINQCHAKVVCTSGKRKLSVPTEIVIISHKSQEKWPEVASLPKVSPSASMYVCFTSGSTGEPKGAVVSHQSFCTARRHQLDSLGMRSDSRVFDFVSYNFDVAVHNAMATLSIGACLCIPSEEQRMTLLNETISDMKATIISITPSAGRILEPQKIPTIQTVVLVGEQVSRVHLEPLWGHFTVCNGYGPAECTPFSTINANPLNIAEAMEIGKAMGVAVWVVDPNNSNKLVQSGAVGELLLEGPTLGRGYLNSPEKTEAAFITDPPWLLQGSVSKKGRRGRIYKTGDLVKVMDNGNLLFIGRKDTQVKIRGQRVELGEVEYHVRALFPSASQIVAEIIFPGGDERKPILAAFIATNEGILVTERETSAQKLKVTEVTTEFLDAISARLPSYMIPGIYLTLKSIPVTASGKIDRRVLRETASLLSQEHIGSPHIPQASQRRQPRTIAEISLQSLWAEVLNIERKIIGLDDSFFRLGGDSITAMALVGSARKAGITLTVTEVFQNPKLCAQASIQASNNLVQPIPPFCLIDSNYDHETLCHELSTICNIDRSLIEDAYPSTALQAGLLSLSSKRTGEYVMQAVLELADNANIEVFQAAWERIFHCTAILRTRLVHHNKLGSLQIVCNEKINWNTANGLDSYLARDRATPFALGDQLCRFALTNESTREKRTFIWTIHHSLYDWWSIGLILISVRDLYAKLLHGKGTDKMEDSMATNFNTFIKYVTEIDKDEEESYWRSYFENGNFSAFPDLPTAPIQPVANALLETELEVNRTKVTSVTMSTLLHATLAVLISHNSGSSDVIFGSVSSGRKASLAGIEEIIGPTIATVPRRVTVRKDQTILEYLQEVQTHMMSTIPYEQTGLQKIAKLSEDTKLGVSFQTLLVVQPEDKGPWAGDTLGSWRTIGQVQEASTYSITIECIPNGNRVKIRVGYDNRIVDGWRIETMVQHFGIILQALVDADTDQMVGYIDQKVTEQDFNLWSWNSSVPLAVEKCVHDLVTERILSQPSLPAIYAWDGDFTYAELNEVSTKLACCLVSLGVGREDVVGLCFEKSVWMAVAMLSVFKAGGAFVPLDPGDAIERRSLYIQKTNARIVLVSASCENISLGPNCKPLVVSHHTISRLPTGDPTILSSRASPHSLAYVIFTSGSTGEPKGVLLEHRSVATSCLGHGSFGLSTESRILQFAPYSFDACIAEIMTTLIHGGCVCVPSARDAYGNLVSAINTMRINVAILTPTIARMIPPETLPGLELLVLAGEAVRRSDYDPWVGRCKLVNGYGPTEAAVCSIAGEYTKEKTEQDSIGMPVACVAWVADPADHERLVPIGAVGELLLEGPILARGYLDAEKQTDAAFIKDPQWLLRGGLGHEGRHGRLYKTGDLVRYTKDGSLSYVGRKDNQVKIRGQRLELGEVEHNVRECIQTAKQVVATVIQPMGAKHTLVVYLTTEIEEDSKSGHLLSIGTITDDLVLVAPNAEIEATLSSRLASHMIPSIYLLIANIPVTASGKTNLKLLQDMGSKISLQKLAEIQSSRDDVWQEPKTEMERLLRDLWVETLRIKGSTIGLGDSFFKLGGDSVAAMALVGAARKSGMLLEVASIFRYPTLGLQAQRITQMETMGTNIQPFSLLPVKKSMVEIREDISVACNVDPSVIEDVYPCTHLQVALMSLSSKRADNYILRGVLELADSVQVDIFKKAVVKASSAAIFRTRILQYQGLGLVQVVLKEDSEWAMPNDLDSYLSQERLQSMSVGDRLSRFAIINSGEVSSRRYFVWSLHRSLYDGWSLGLFMEDVWTVYSALSSGGLEQNISIERPAFNIFVTYLQQVDQENKDRIEDYWKSYLGDIEYALFPTLPASVQEPIASQVLERKCQVKSNTEFTMSTLIRASLSLLICRYTGSQDILFGAVVSGRYTPIIGIEELMGPTLATVPIRARLNPDQSVTDFLKTLQQEAIEMIHYEQTGLPRIATMSESGKAACSFQTLLIVHPEGDKIRADAILGKWHTPIGHQGFSSNSLTLDCLIGESSVNINASFDSRVMGTVEVEKFLDNFSLTLQQLSNSSHELVGSVGSVLLFDCS